MENKVFYDIKSALYTDVKGANKSTWYHLSSMRLLMALIVL